MSIQRIPASIEVLKDKIEVFIREIATEILQRVCQKWTNKDFMQFFELYMFFFEKTFLQLLKNHTICRKVGAVKEFLIDFLVGLNA